MPTSTHDNQRQQLKQAIAAQESLRETLGDAVVDLTVAALRRQLDDIQAVSEPVQQRKLLTIIFIDVVNSTRLLGEIDPEENMAIMDAALRRLAAPLEARGGRVLRYMGDGYLAAFGLPQARENDPEMALRAGLDVITQARQIAQELVSEHAITDFDVRVGINTGLVVSGGETEGDNTIMGASVNLAARLESAAPPGGLLISQQTYNHVRGLFEVSSADPVQAKGFAEPVQVYRVLRAAPHSFRLATRGVEGIETAMVGRDRELTRLHQVLAAAQESPIGRGVTIVGEAGLGKSRLLAEFEKELAHQQGDLGIFRARATLESLDLPNGLLRELLARRAGILDDDRIKVVKEKLTAAFEFALGVNEAAERKAHVVAQMIGFEVKDSPHLDGLRDDPKQLHNRGQNYLIQYIKACAALAPVVLLLEDIHWADASSIDSLQLLFAETSDDRFLAIALGRPSLFDRYPDWAQTQGYERLDLQPLSPADSERLAADVLQKVEVVPDSLHKLLVKHSEGNPFYLEELVKMLVDDGLIVTGPDRWRVRSELLGSVRIPPTLTGVLQARIESLPAEERLVLQQASVIGRVFWDEAVCFLQDQDGLSPSRAAETYQLLDQLRVRDMIVRQTESVFSEASEFLFRHAMLREVTYEGVLKRVRQVYHGVVADWLVANSGERKAEVSGLIAGHLEKANRPDAAVTWFVRAAETATANYANKEADDFYTRALALVPDADLEARYDILAGRTTVADTLGDRDAQRRDLDVRLELAAALNDSNKQFEVWLDRSWLAYWTSDFSQTIASAEEAQRFISPMDTQAEQRVNNVMAWGNLQMRQYQVALGQAQTACRLSLPLENPELAAHSLMTLAVIYSYIGDYSASLQNYQQAYGIAAEANLLNRKLTIQMNMAIPRMLLGHYEQARQDFQAVHEEYSELDYRPGMAINLVNLAWVDQTQERWEEARQLASKGLALMREVEFLEGAAEALLWLGHALLGLGRSAEAQDCYQESLEARIQLEQPALAMGVRAGLARAAAALGNQDQAQAYAVEIAEYIDDGATFDGTWEPLRIYLTCYDLLESAADPRAMQILTKANEFLEDRAKRIQDDQARRSYLENVPWNRVIRELWRESQDAA
jgi:class 3 adenylate cyclase/tetratricopeptide (TPR) repeat protein